MIPVCTILKSKKMNTPAFASNSTKLYSYQPPLNLINALTPSEPRQKKTRQFTTALAHEIRNPLSNINLAVEMMKFGLSDNDQKTYLDIIMRSSVRINDLITELLKHQETNEEDMERHSIHQLLDEVIEMAKDRIMLKNITVLKKYDTKDFRVVLSWSKMKIALTNIIVNAIEAMDPDNGELKLVTKLADNRCTIEIEDNGCGVCKDDLKYIFKPNYTNKLGGLGLGLAATYDILQLNHVEVFVESELQKGTRFILCFEKEYQQLFAWKK